MATNLTRDKIDRLRLIVVFENQKGGKRNKFFTGNDYYNESLQKLILLVSRVKFWWPLILSQNCWKER